MDRKVLLLYLKDVRDLEFAMRKIVSMYNCEKKAYQSQKKRLDRLEYKVYSNWRDSEIGIGIVMTILLLLGGLAVSNVKFIGGFLAVLAIIGAIITGCYTFKLYAEGEEAKVAVENYNRQQKSNYDANREKSKRLTEEWKKRFNYWCDEYDKVKVMLSENYSLNILPNQYRNIASVYYIYDYMVSSQASLNDTLMHEHLENGIQRILSKLNVIIRQNEEIIFQSRIKEANDRDMITQTQKMLRALESNSSMAAEYARISANHSRANSFFALADYLEKNKK